MNQFTVLAHTPTGGDRLGNPKPEDTREVVVWGAAPAGSTELINGQATVIDQDTLYGPYDTTVTSQDTLEVPEGLAIPAGKYHVEGTPQRWKNPLTGTEGGCVVRLTGVKG